VVSPLRKSASNCAACRRARELIMSNSIMNLAPWNVSKFHVIAASPATRKFRGTGSKVPNCRQSTRNKNHPLLDERIALVIAN
jgi:hypothetical protein